jgi:hypothetical protein
MEGAPDRATLEKLITEKTNKSNGKITTLLKSLQNEIKELKKKAPSPTVAKNGKRGQKSGASNKKKSAAPKTTPSKKEKPKAKNPKAGAVDNATQQKKKGKGPTKSKPKSKGKRNTNSKK